MSMDDMADLPGLPLVQALGQSLSRLELDYAFLDIFIRVQHDRLDEALVLVEALLVVEGETPDLVLAQAVILSLKGAHERALAACRVLDRLAPVEIVTGRAEEERVRARSYIKARAIFALTGELDADGRAALDFYLRRGAGSRARPMKTVKPVSRRSGGNR